MNGKIKEFIDFLGQYQELLDDLMLREKDKRQALLDNDLKRIESVLQQQQASMMKLKNFEQKRMEMQAELGYANMSAEDMLKALESDGREEVKSLRPVFKKMKDSAQQIKELNKLSTELAKKNLKFIELIMQESGDGADGIYGSQGSKDTRSGHSIEKMI